jgi:RNA recognition motif-containing protein
VGNLSFLTTENQLTDLFSQSGKVMSTAVIPDKITGKSRGVAFVEMSSAEETSKAIESLHGKELDGRALSVNVAHPKEDRPNGDSNGGSNGGRRPRFLNVFR